MGRFMIVQDPNTWIAISNKLQKADFYYSYEYCSLVAREENGILYAAYFEDEEGRVFYPFIKRMVPQEDNLFDIVTPYGYGGPIVEGDLTLTISFQEEFNRYCEDHNIITETIRFHPLTKNYLQQKNLLEIEYIRNTTAVDLSLPLETIKENYTTMLKRNIKKARKNNLTCFAAENSLQNIYLFMEMYKETMDRNNASEYYYFDERYFIELMNSKSLGKPYILFTQNDNEIIAGVIVFVGKEYSHYHLGGSKKDHFHLRANNLLFDFMIEFCKGMGSRLLHLGGGYQENDNLFKFKTSFTNNNNYEYYLGKQIFNKEKYDSIIKSLESLYVLNHNYFPAYRGITGKKMEYTS